MWSMFLHYWKSFLFCTFCGFLYPTWHFLQHLLFKKKTSFKLFKNTIFFEVVGALTNCSNGNSFQNVIYLYFSSILVCSLDIQIDVCVFLITVELNDTRFVVLKLLINSTVIFLSKNHNQIAQTSLQACREQTHTVSLWLNQTASYITALKHLSVMRGVMLLTA